MSSEISWPTSLGLSREDSDMDVEPKFEQPEYFRKVVGKNWWYCTACSPHADPEPHATKVTKAMSHEKSQAHKETIADMLSWQLPADAWGLALRNRWGIVEAEWGVEVEDWGPSGAYERLRYSELGQSVPLKKRVKRWIRDMAKAEGVELEVDEDLDNDEQPDWTQWGGEGDDGDDWNRPKDDWQPPAEEERDPRAVADFKFVERIAKKHGLDRNRLHVFYRLPTEEKIKRIKSIVTFLHSH